MKISAIMLGHREGLLAGPSISSFLEAIDHATEAGLTVEPLVVLDRADAITQSMFEDVPPAGAKILHTDFGDPALARNQGVAESSGDFVTFLDADDLWSFNWIVEAFRFVSVETKPCIGHSELNVVFGDAHQIWMHVDSEDPGVDLTYLRLGNFWDALCLAARQVFLDRPYRQNDLTRGYGHEDWHWNCRTLLSGCTHRPVPGTVHMKRRRQASQSARCDEQHVMPWPTELCRYDWTRNGS